MNVFRCKDLLTPNSPSSYVCGCIYHGDSAFVSCSLSIKLIFFFLQYQNFLYTAKDESSPLKAIDFGLSDFARPGQFFFNSTVAFIISSSHYGIGFNARSGLQMRGLMILSEVHTMWLLRFYIDLIVQRLMYGV